MMRMALCSVALLAIACGPGVAVAPLNYQDRPSAPEEQFRAAPPQERPVVEVVDAAPNQTVLPNGLRVIHFQRAGFPTVALGLWIDRGSVDLDDPGGLRIAQLTHLYARGGDERVTDSLSVLQSQLGARTAHFSTPDGLFYGVQVAATDIEAGLKVLATTTFGAALTDVEYNHRATQWQMGARLGGIGAAQLPRLILFGRAQAYGYVGLGTEVISLETARAMHTMLFQPAHATLVVVGNATTAQGADAAQRVLGAVPSGPELKRRTARVETAPAPKISVRRARGHTQTYAAIIARGPTGTSDDTDALEIAALVLGGTHSSDLTHHLRDETGAAYSVSSAFARLRSASWMTFAGSYNADLLTGSLQSTLNAIEKLRTGSVAPDDLRAAKESSLASWRSTMSGSLTAATAYALAVATDDIERLRTYPSHVANVDHDAVVAVAKKYLGREGLRIVIAGDDRWLNVGSLGMGPPTLLAEDQSAPSGATP